MWHLYKSKKNNPYVIRISIRMLGEVDYSALRFAVNMKMSNVKLDWN